MSNVADVLRLLTGGVLIICAVLFFLLLFLTLYFQPERHHDPPHSLPRDLGILLAPQHPPRIQSVTPDLELGQQNQLRPPRNQPHPVLFKVDYPCPQICTLLLEDGINIIINYKNYQQLPETRDHTDCVICLCEFEAEESCCVLGRCRHVFHYPCAKSWLAKNRICPLCRSLAVPTRPV